MSSQLKPTIIKIMAFKSGNRCAYPGCPQVLVLDGNNTSGAAIVGELAHIAGEKPGAARYDKYMNDEQRNGLDNLLYLCATHHTLVDKPGNTFSVEMISAWKYVHEAKTSQPVLDSVPDVTFAELEIVTRALAEGITQPFDGDFQLTNPSEKMERNGMTARSRTILTMGLAASREVRAFIQSTATVIPFFEERLRTGFQTQYDQLWLEGLRGDDLFEALCLYASKYSQEYRLRAASLAVVAYLFEACDVFQR